MPRRTWKPWITSYRDHFLPKEIKDAVNDGSLAVFIGAGVSRIVGCWGWGRLAQELIKRSYKEGILYYKEKESVLENRDHRKIITIAYNLLKDNREKEELFYECMEDALLYGKRNEKKIKSANNIYDKIIKLRGTFVTTNADVLFDNKFTLDSIFINKKDFTPKNIPKEKTNQLFHIHGSIKDRSSLVFTLPQYMERYSNKDFRNFLRNILITHTTLFLGYGLTELELLQFLLEKDDSPKEHFKKHYMLSPFYMGEENLLRLEQLYYSE